jgi:uncharacterized membrane protein
MIDGWLDIMRLFQQVHRETLFPLAHLLFRGRLISIFATIVFLVIGLILLQTRWLSLSSSPATLFICSFSFVSIFVFKAPL